MATLADELLNDFEESGSEGEGDQEQGLGLLPSDKSTPTEGNNNGRSSSSAALQDGMELDDDEEAEDGDENMRDGTVAESRGEIDVDDEEATKAKVEKMQLRTVRDVHSVATLMGSLEPVLEKIVYYQNLPPEKQTTTIGSIEDNPEYHLLTQSNSLSTSIDNEIILVHKFTRDHYSVRFPELETLITNPLDYAKTVAIIQNGPMDEIKNIAQSSDNLVGASLKTVLDGPSLMIVTVEATTTRGSPLAEPELQAVLAACKMTLALDHAKRTITSYVQSRMNIFAPNLTALIGSLTAAQLLNFAGGLRGLAKTPACNIPPLGSKKQSNTGFATNVGVRQQGFLYHSPIIRTIPSDLKRQAMRIVSAKLILAARCDVTHTTPDGSLGESLKAQCLTRLDKLTEPPPNRGPRALPAPDDKPSRKRGGRRVRKAKEATAMTDLRKAQNRMAFGKEEKEVGYGTGESTTGLGMIGKANDGRIRALQIDQRTRAKLSKRNQGWGTGTPLPGTASSLHGAMAGNSTILRAHGLRSSGVGTLGTASSIAFTPVQGLELVDPKVQAELSRKRKAEEDRWFKGGTFTQIGDSSTPAKRDSAGFKVPQLPARKKIDTGEGKKQ